MRWIFEFVVRYRNVCSLLVTSIISIMMISGTPEQQAAAARALTVTVFYPFQVTVNQVRRVSNIFAENRRLKQQVVALSTRVSLLEEQAVENERLKKLLDLSGEFSYELIPVRVMARDPSPLYRSIVVNAGNAQGVLKWMPLVSEQGVVGKVSQVVGHVSLAQLLKDPSNRTSVMARRTRTVGILETENGHDFFVRFRSHEDVGVGDTVVTSGLGGIYPRGLQVGFVNKIVDNHNPLFKKAALRLSVDFDRLEELYVMKLSPQWAAFRTEFDSLKFEQ